MCLLASLPVQVTLYLGLAVDELRPPCRPRGGCRECHREPDDSDGFRAPNLEAEDSKTQGALGRHAQVGGIEYMLMG